MQRRTVARIQRRTAAGEQMVGTWESTVPATWSPASPSEASIISLDQAPTPLPNTGFRMQESGLSIVKASQTASASQEATDLTTTTTTTTTSTATTSCDGCDATTSAAAANETSNDTAADGVRVPLLVVIAIFGSLAVAALLYVAWRKCKRRRTMEEQAEQDCLRGHSNTRHSARRSMPEGAVGARSAGKEGSLVGSTLVPDGRSSSPTLVPGPQQTMELDCNVFDRRGRRYGSAPMACYADAVTRPPERPLPPIPWVRSECAPPAPPPSPVARSLCEQQAACGAGR
ncbi:hypothetical protein CERZMDRAFT_82060 [Cercospora zeae-maydis SCOH1-5]|uniref:Uncharacterized protein n=1 Tax=Cercospora zeae-maydis SCOH1-5 TaxID=717836 RepID=A0A6A6FR84_9PEZI|nr:hypothetical protein CERZMDRAFT_82060 [Cercospora zeae-maydis SCOH1-5]